MAGTNKRIAGPAYIASSATNIFTPTSTLRYRIRHIHCANKHTVAETFTLYVDTTGGSTGGKELIKDMSLAAAGSLSSMWDFYGDLVLEGSASTDFLVGIAAGASHIVITVSGIVEVL
jgi:hypothetical protein